jgi:rhodanese-related sulfurtransferase
MMKSLTLLLFVSIVTAFQLAAFDSGYSLIEREELKAWIENDQDVVIIDARSDQYDDGQRIPKAIALPHTSDETSIYETIPCYSAILVVYCTNLRCPASKFLIRKLINMGYENIYKYVEGIEDWIDAGYPIELESERL